MKRTSRSVYFAAHAAAAALVVSATAGTASAIVNTNDIALGCNNSGSSLYLLSNATSYPSVIQTTPWGAVPFMESMVFDNFDPTQTYGSSAGPGTLSGVTVPSNAQHFRGGNLIGVNFGSSATGATLTEFATNGSSTNTSFFNYSTYSSLGLTTTRVGGIAVSPNNGLIAMSGYDAGDLQIMQYNDGGTSNAGTGAGASIGTYAAQTGQIYGTAHDIGVTFYGNNNVISMDTSGNLHETNISGSGPYTLTDNTVASVLPGGTTSANTFVYYNPILSPFVYAIDSTTTSSSTHNAEDTNTLFIFDPRSSFGLISGESSSGYDLSYSTLPATVSQLDSGTIETARQFSMDSAGDLLFTTYSNEAGTTGTTIYDVPGLTALAAGSSLTSTSSLVGSISLLGTGYGSRNSFQGMDIALGTPIPAPSGLTWTGSASNHVPTDASGTWDSSTMNWTNGASNVSWSEAPAAGALFGAGGTANATVTVSTTHTVAYIGFNADSGSNTGTYTLTPSAGTGTITIVGDAGNDGINATNTAVVNDPLVIGNGSSDPNTIVARVSSGSTLTLGGTLSGNRLYLGGSGTVLLTNTNNAQAGTTLDGAIVPVTNPAVFGPTSDYLEFSGGTLFVNSTVAISNAVALTKQTTVNTNGNNITFSQPMYGGGGFVKTGAGTMTLNAAEDPTDFGDNSGTSYVMGGTVVDNAVNTGTVDTGYTALGAEAVVVGGTTGTGTLELAVNGGGFNVHLDKGGTYASVGVANLYNNGSLAIVRQTSASNVFMNVPNATDTLQLSSAMGQWSNLNPSVFFGDTDVTVNKTGSGRVELSSGGVQADTTFGGSWLVSSGILQLGPVIANTAASPTGSEAPFGEPLNALGFKDLNNVGTQSDPDSPNTVTITNGGILALGVDSFNNNPNNTVIPVNPTPNFLRSPVVLSGGAIASTGSEVEWGASSGDTENEGAPTGVPVSANFGGTFTLGAGTTSMVLVTDPNGKITAPDTTARTVNLVGGVYEIENASPDYQAGSMVIDSTVWNAGTLEISPGSLTTGGVFNIDRTFVFDDWNGNYTSAGSNYTGTGTLVSISVTTGAAIKIDQGAGVDLAGVCVLNDGTHFVNIINNSTTSTSGTGLDVQTNQAVGAISGTGNTVVEPGVTLTPKSIVQGQVTVNGTLTQSNAAASSNVGSVIIGSAGVVNANAGAFQMGNLSSDGTLNVANGVTVTLTAGTGSAGTSVLGPHTGNATFNLGSTGTFDLSEHGLVWYYDNSADPVSTLVTYVTRAVDRDGSGFPQWDKPGLTSNYAQQDYQNEQGTGVGVMDNQDYIGTDGGDYNGSTFMGKSITSDNVVLARYTYYGDTNLDGVVDGTDVTDLQAGFAGGTQGDPWFFGDFNYDGNIDSTDVTLLILGFEAQGSEPVEMDASMRLALAQDPITPTEAWWLIDNEKGLTAAQIQRFESMVGVPEPTTLALAGVAAAGLLGRRRRR